MNEERSHFSNSARKRKKRISKVSKVFGYSLLTLVLAAYTWKEHLEDRIVPKRWGVVEETSIYRSGQLHPALIKRVLLEQNVQVIVDLNGKRAGKVEHETEDAVSIELGIDKNRYPLNGDGTGDIEQYAQAIAAIDRAVKTNKAVLVHCSAGSQRTGGVIAMYRSLVQKRDVLTILEEMERYDWNPEKDRVLTEYLDKNMETLAERLVSLEVLDRVPTGYPSFVTGTESVSR